MHLVTAAAKGCLTVLLAAICCLLILWLEPHANGIGNGWSEAL